MNPRSERQSFLGPRSDEVLSALRIGIIGLGGGGSHIAQQLAHVGLRELVLFDPDRIEESNLNRLVGGTLADVRAKESKVVIARRTILGIRPEAEVIPVGTAWQENAEVIRDCDFLFGCVDSFSGRDELERAARRYLIPYIDIGIDVHRTGGDHFITGQVALSMPGEVCLRCMNVLRDDLLAEEAEQYGAAGARPQVVWSNGVLAATAVGMMMQVATPWQKSSRPPCLLEYDGNSHEIRVSSSAGFLKEKRCPHFVSIDDLGDPWFGERTNPNRH